MISPSFIVCQEVKKEELNGENNLQCVATEASANPKVIKIKPWPGQLPSAKDNLQRETHPEIYSASKGPKKLTQFWVIGRQ